MATYTNKLSEMYGNDVKVNLPGVIRERCAVSFSPIPRA